jgi:hypothetical protein
MMIPLPVGFGITRLEIITIPLEGDLAHKDSMGIQKSSEMAMCRSWCWNGEASEFNQTKTNELNTANLGLNQKCRTALPTNYTRSRRTK